MEGLFEKTDLSKDLKDRRELPKHTLGQWTFWAEERVCAIAQGGTVLACWGPAGSPGWPEQRIGQWGDKEGLQLSGVRSCQTLQTFILRNMGAIEGSWREEWPDLCSQRMTLAATLGIDCEWPHVEARRPLRRLFRNPGDRWRWLWLGWFTCSWQLNNYKDVLTAS